ncbi:MAG: HD-GYP domain-containing protein [Phycisphaerales bacterium JB043]
MEPKNPSSDHRKCFSFDIESAPKEIDLFDIYLLHEHTPRPTLYAAKGIGLSEQERRRLMQQGVQRLYAPIEQHQLYRELLLDELEHTYHDETLDDESRYRCVRALILRMIDETLRPDELIEPFITMIELSQCLARWATEDPALFSTLLDLSDYSFSLPHHLYNTAIGAAHIALLERPSDTALLTNSLLAGFLHDIALAGVRDEIVCKLGTLTPEEWHDIHAHPYRAYNTLKDCPDIPALVLDCIYNHHERMDNGGYPRGLGAQAIDALTNIVIIADTFDTIRAARPGRQGLHPIDAIETMFEGIGAHFAQRPMMIWQQIVNESIRALPERIDQQRTPRDENQASNGNLTRLLQAGPKGMRPYSFTERSSQPLGHGHDERRGAPRVAYERSIRACVLHRGKLSTATIGQEVMLISVEVSLTGIQVITPWAFSKGDIFMLNLPKPGDKVIAQRARVVRVRKREDGNWIAGLEFLAHAQVPRGISAA